MGEYMTLIMAAVFIGALSVAVKVLTRKGTHKTTDKKQGELFEEHPEPQPQEMVAGARH